MSVSERSPKLWTGKLIKYHQLARPQFRAPLKSSLAMLAVADGGVVSAVLPILAKSLASERQKKRFEQAISDIGDTLKMHEQAIRELSDAQYKLIGGVILALTQTTDDDKVQYLKLAVQNGLHQTEIRRQEAVMLGRLLRDISAEEACFLIGNFGFERVWFNESPVNGSENIIAVKPSSLDGLVVAGLISLGLLLPAEPTWDDSGLLRFAPLVAKLLALLRTS